MPLRSRYFFCLIALISVLTQLFPDAIAQETRLDTTAMQGKGFSIGVNCGPTLYFGNIRTHNFMPVFDPYSEVQFAYGLIFAKSFGKSYQLRLQLINGKLAGVEKSIGNGDSGTRYFQGNITELSLQPEVNLSNLVFGEDAYRRFFIKGFAGPGIVFYRAKLKNYGTGKILGLVGYSDTDLSKSKPASAFVVPMGLNFQYQLTSRLSLYSEISYHLFTAGNLDALKGPNSNDAFLYTAIGATFHFLPKKKKVTFTSNYIPPPKIEKPEVESTEDNSKGFGFLPLTPKPPVEEVPVTPSTDLEYRVQILATYMQRIPVSDFVERYKFNQGVKEYYTDGWYQYSVGSFAKMEDANHFKNRLAVENGLTDAFVVVFKNGNRFYQGKRKSFSFNVVGDELITFPKPEISEELEFENVEFRVQIAAMTGKKILMETLKEKYDLKNEPIHLDSMNGRYYYTVGSYRNLRQAREYCKILISRNLVYDAFVISYVDGVRKTLSQITTKVTSDGKKTVETKEGYVFRIQLLVVNSKKVPLNMFKEKYGLRESVIEEKRENNNVYLCGQFKTYEAAMEYQAVCRKAGVSDAFVVAYQNKKRVPLKDALLEY